MKLKKVDFLKFIGFLQSKADEMNENDTIDTETLVVKVLPEIPVDRFQIKVTSENIKEIGSMTKFLNKIGMNKNSLRYDTWVRNKHSNLIYSVWDYKKFPKTSVVDIEFIKKYMNESK